MSFFEVCWLISLVFVALSFAFSFMRLVQGPSDVDRIVCLDLLAMIVAALLCLISLFARDSRYMDAVLVISVIAFLGTVLFAQSIKSKSLDSLNQTKNQTKGAP
jgi:multicomponent Na+:H+ antiporter subunit F